MTNAKDFGLCPYCLSGNGKTGVGCTWAEEHPDMARNGVDRPCYCDISAERDRRADTVRTVMLFAIAAGITAGAFTFAWWMS